MADDKKVMNLEEALGLHKSDVSTVEKGFKEFDKYEKFALPKLHAERLTPAMDTFYTTFKSHVTKKIGDLDTKLSKDHTEHIEDALSEALHKYVTDLHPEMKDMFSKDLFKDKKKRLEAMQTYFENHVLGQAGKETLKQMKSSGIHTLNELAKELIKDKNTTLSTLLNQVDSYRSSNTQAVLQNYVQRSLNRHIRGFGQHEILGYLKDKMKGKFEIDPENSHEFMDTNVGDHLSLYRHITDPDSNPLNKSYKALGLKKYEPPKEELKKAA